MLLIIRKIHGALIADVIYNEQRHYTADVLIKPNGNYIIRLSSITEAGEPNDVQPHFKSRFADYQNEVNGGVISVNYIDGMGYIITELEIKADTTKQIYYSYEAMIKDNHKTSQTIKEVMNGLIFTYRNGFNYIFKRNESGQFIEQCKAPHILNTKNF